MLGKKSLNDDIEKLFSGVKNKDIREKLILEMQQNSMFKHSKKGAESFFASNVAELYYVDKDGKHTTICTSNMIFVKKFEQIYNVERFKELNGKKNKKDIIQTNESISFMCYDLVNCKMIRVPLKDWSINPFMTVRLIPIFTLENIKDKKLLTQDIIDLIEQLYSMINSIIIKRRQELSKEKSKTSKSKSKK